MTFSAVGTIIGSTSATSFTLVPHTVGDFILFEVTGENTTSTPASLTSTNVTWAPLTAAFTGTTNTWSARVFIGTVTSTSSATVTIGWTGAAPATFGCAGQEFASSVGAASVTLDVQGHLDSTGTNTWPSLTATHGAGELYFGFMLDGGAFTFSNGTPAGYVYQNDANSNGLGYDLSSGVGAAGGIGTDGGSLFGIAVLVYEAGTAAVASPPPQLVPPGLQSPMVLAEPPRFSTPAPPRQQPAPAPAPVPPGLQSPMALAVPLRPATQAPPAPPPPPTGTPAPQPVPPGLQSPMSLTVPARFSQPAPPQQQPAPAPQPVPPGLQSPMALAVPGRPATSAAPPPPVTAVASPAPLLTPPGLQSPMSLTVPSRPATSTPPAPPAVAVPGTAQIHPPGRMSPMSIGLPLVQPPQGAPPPGPPPPTPPIPSGVILGIQGAPGGDRDPEIRMFRSVMPGEVPVSGSALPKLQGRGYAAPPPSRADDVEVLWEAPAEPAAPPGPTPAEIARREAQRAVSGLYDLGRIIAPEPYVPPSKTRCGAIRKLGAETLRCGRKRGHPGMHTDRGVRWG